MVSQGDAELRIMLLDDNPGRGAWVQQCIHQLGFAACSIVTNPLRVLKEISEQQPDVIIIDMQSPGRDILESLSLVAEHQPTPVVMFSEEQDPEYIKKAVQAGVCTYLLGSIDPDTVRPVIDVALAQFRSFQSLRQALDETRLELSERRSIDQAKHMLMRVYNVTEEEAYEQMRKQAMRCNQRMVEVARRLLENQPRPAAGDSVGNIEGN